MTTIAPDLLKRLRSKVKEHPEFLETLEFLAREPESSDDGGREPSPELLALARKINAARQAEYDEDILRHSLSTEETAVRLGVTSRQAVAQRRQRGRLYGIEVGGKFRYPSWQFATKGTVAGLQDLIELLKEYGVTDGGEADSILRMTHRGLQGRTLLDVWRDGDDETLQAWLADIGGWRL